MPYSLKQAADATGKTKPTILRAIQSNKISAKKDEHGEWEIDPAELHRVYPPSPEGDARSDTQTDTRNGKISNEMDALEQEIALLREMLAERDRRVADKDGVIDDLRARLDRADEERRRTQMQLTALLTDQREKQEAAQQAPAPAKKRWRLFG
ncbi:MAG TPA: hypothetical protein VMF32_24635 [Xanthobacteraceae bacterium]|nr:hypothetical protein [Xanthobacteraceae bacterium]